MPCGPYRTPTITTHLFISPCLNTSLSLSITYMRRFMAVTMIFVSSTVTALSMPPSTSDDCNCRYFAIKSNLIHDVLLTPDVGLEMPLPNHFSVGLEGIYAWWNNDQAHRYWRIRGGSLEVKYWLGAAAEQQVLCGHHIGLYASCHDYDFEFGGKGWQSKQPTFGGGIIYGYSFRLNKRLRLDLNIRAGYSGGKITEYIPQCDRYVCIDRYYKHYFGPTGIGITLVWFPGRDNFNNPMQ